MSTWVWVVIVALFLLVWQLPTVKEGFLTVDPDAIRAQRQQLQYEGERRYNDLARLQAPTTTKIAPADIASAVQQAIPMASVRTSSLLELIGAAKHGGIDDGTNKQGSSVEQTGTVQDKIAFCESLTQVNCDQLSDPRLAECGFCHKDGVNSAGKPWRGGMYIASDDQIRANEVSNATGQPAQYKPTIGSCAPENFTLMTENCQARELQLQCLKAGGPTQNNACATCYGGTSSSTGGMLYVGPKPREYVAQLWLSHPGLHHFQGTGTIVTLPDGSTRNIPYSTNPVLAPTMVVLTLKEGDTFGIKVFGAPMTWCAWLSSPDGKRTVSIDIGLQNESANPGMVIAGDKRSATVATAVSKYATDAATWTTFQSQVPNTTMWYSRRDEVLNGGVLSATYGDSNNRSDVSATLKGLAGLYVDVTVGPDVMGTDPSPGNSKYLSISLDNGQNLVVADGQTIPKQKLNNSFNFQIQVPATLVDPLFTADLAACPTGPLVFTEVGAGLMGSHSCFKADGSFNPTQYCLQELFLAAGGTQQGQAFPNTDAKVAALVVNNSLDDTVTALNNLGSIAQFGVDTNGAPADFNTLKSASLAMTGRAVLNPCDTTAQTGNHSPECLDYLWRTANDPSMDQAAVDPTTLPYGLCSKEGAAAPLNPDGSVNQANVQIANEYGAIPNVRGFFQSIYNRSQDSSNFDLQAAAMKQCFNVTIQPPVEPASACPLPNTDELQCITPEMLQKPEVFGVFPGGGYKTTQQNAATVCGQFGAQVATYGQLQEAQQAGGEWCGAAWVSDNNQTAFYPMSTAKIGCGNMAGVVAFGGGWLPNTDPNSLSSQGKGNPATAMAGVNCYGMKPPAGTPDVRGWTENQWYRGTAGISDTAVPACLSHGGALATSGAAASIQCVGSGNTIQTWGSAAECQAAVAGYTAPPPLLAIQSMNPTLAQSLVNYYVARA